jgi:hypothetical protein
MRLFLTALLAAGAVFASGAVASAPPVGALPPGPTTTIVTKRGSLVAVALPRAAASTGLVWRIARSFDSRVVQEATEGDVGKSVVLVFKAVAPGRTKVVFALTKGESAKAVRAATYDVRVT